MVRSLCLRLFFASVAAKQFRSGIRKYSLNSSCKPATINVAIPTLQQYLMEASRTGMPLVSYNDHGRLSMLYSKSRSAIRDFSAFFVRAFVR